MNRSLLRPLTVAGLSLSVLLVGCGATGGTLAEPGAVEQVDAGLGARSAAATLTSAGRTTAKVSSERVTITTTTSGLDGQELTVQAEGSFDAAAKRGRMVTSITGGSGRVAELGASEVIYDGDTVYLRAGLLELFSDGKPWIKVSSEHVGTLVDKLDGSVQSEPGAFLDMLEGAGTVAEVGTEEVGGTSTTHYEATLDLTKALDELDADRRQKLERQIGQLGASLDGVKAVPAEVWIDGDGYVRRFTTTIDVGAAAPDSKRLDGLTVTTTVELSAFGEPVAITVPKASEVSELDVSKLLGD